jgi:hypothetical protein
MEMPLNNGTGREPKLAPAGLSVGHDGGDLGWLRDGLSSLSLQIEAAGFLLVQLAGSRAAENLTEVGKAEFDRALEEAQDALVAARHSVGDAIGSVF